MRHFDAASGVGTFTVRWLFPYNKVWIRDEFSERMIRNTLFDEDQTSKYLLDLKKTSSYNFRKAVKFCTESLVQQINDQKLIEPQERATLCVVPSSTAEQLSPGICEIIKNLVKYDSRFIDGQKTIRRHRTIDKLAEGGSREIQVHRDSLTLGVPVLNKGPYIVLDDITTSGNSMAACAELLFRHEVRKIIPVAFGKTV